jgi:hypothetical protein
MRPGRARVQRIAAGLLSEPVQEGGGLQLEGDESGAGHLDLEEFAQPRIQSGRQLFRKAPGRDALPFRGPEDAV